MDTTALRQKLLDLAIRGRLVPQNPDEPAIELDAEDTVPESEQPFEIPENWRWVKLGHIGDWRSGSTPKRNILAYYENGNIPWLKTGDLTDGIVSSIPECITEKAFSESSMRLNPKGSVLIAMYGATIGKLGILDIESTTNQACCACIADNNLIINWFLFYYLLSQRKEFIALGAGGAQPNISRQKIISYPIPLPPLPEQERIAAKLEQLFEVIDRCEEAQKQIAETATQLRTSLLQAAIQGRLVPQNPDEQAIELDAKDTVPESEQPFEIPENWRWVRLSKLIDKFQYGYTASAKSEGKIKLLRITDITAQGVNWDSVPFCENIDDKDIPKYQLETNDILIARTGGTIGKSFRIENLNEPSIFASYLIRARITDNNLHPQYLENYFNTPWYWSQLKTKSRGIGQPNVNSKSLGDLLIPLPPLPEQEHIAAKLEQLFTVIDTIQQAAI